MRTEAQHERATRRIVFACFFLSGATGLVYQGVWYRHLHGLFGVTTHALAVVVAAFLGGLAAGSWALGRAADRSTRPLLLYGGLEIGVALLALLVQPTLGAVERLYVLWHPASDSKLALSLVRFVLAAAALLPPTFLMGGTLPSLAVLLRREFGRESSRLQARLGALYGWNTLGAVCGTGLAGFVLLVQFGLAHTTWIAAGINLGLGILCVALGRRARPTSNVLVDDATPEHLGDAAAATGVRFLGLAFAVSGAISLVYEVAWTRILTQIIGSSTYAFSMILSAFLLGLALGSLVIGRIRVEAKTLLRAFCWAELGIGAGAALVVPFFARLPEVQLRAFQVVQDPDGVLALQFVLCWLAVLVPTFFMGATFPLAAAYVARHSGAFGNAVGRLYAGNTLGGIAGSIAAAFLALPQWGTQRTLLGAVIGNASIALVGLALIARQRLRAREWAFGGAAVAIIALAWLAPAWDPYALDAGVAVGGPPAARGARAATLREVARGSDILFYREGTNANISVRRDETQLYLKTNGKTDGTSRGDMPTQLMLGLLPSLLHPEPRHSLVIGLGTGASAAAALAPPALERLDVIEIEPAVIDAARQFFAEVHGDLFSDGRCHLWIEDARAYLLTAPQHYDIIVSEPSNPWIAGVASLFSVEHYERCASRLGNGGILAQWLQTYAMQPELVRMVLASMQVVFPHMQVYSFHHGDLIVLASATPLPAFDLGGVEARLDAWDQRVPVQRHLGITSATGIAAFHLLNTDDVRRFAQGAELNTDDRPRLEFAAPRSLYLSTRDTNAALLRNASSRPLAAFAPGQAPHGEAWLDAARAALRLRRPSDARVFIDAALAEASTSRPAAWTLSAEVDLAQGQVQPAAEHLEAALQRDPGQARAAFLLGRMRVLQGRVDEGVDWLRRSCAAPAGDPEACLQLVELALQTGRAALARQSGEALLEDASRFDPVAHARLLGLVARAAFETRDLVAAEHWARAGLAMRAQNTGAWRVLGGIAFQAGRYDEAVDWWQRLVDYRQTGVEVLLPLAQALERSGDRRQARRFLEWALLEEPEHPLANRLRDEWR